MRVIFPTDEHYPFQDERARSVALKIAQDFDPELRIAGSDGIDFYSISKYDKNPARIKAFGLQNEIDLWKGGQLEWLSATPNAKVFFIKGNHEDRLRRWLWRNPDIADLDALQLPTLLDMNRLKIYWEKNKGESANLELNIYNKLLIKHGDIVRKFSAYSAKAELEAEHFSISVLTGHTHRGGTHYATTRRGAVVAQEGFCLCSLDPEYTTNPNWQQGIVLATVTPESLFMEPIPFYEAYGKKRAIWRDKEYVE